MDDIVVVSKTLLPAVKKHRQELGDIKRNLENRISSLLDDLGNDLSDGEQLLDILPASCSEVDVDNSLAKSEYESKMSIYQNSSTVDESSLSDLYRKLENLSNRYSYMICINRIRECNQALQIQCELRDFVSVAENFDQLSSICSQLKTSQCKKLASYASAVKKPWKIFLKKLIRQTLEQELKNFISPSDEITKNFSELKSILGQMIILFHALKKKKLDDFDEFTDCLIGPLRKRFVYHFADPKKLQAQPNNLNDVQASSTSEVIEDTTFLKPEWYLSLILKWNEKYSSIFKTLTDEYNQESLNDMLDKKGRSILREAVSVIRIDFARGLVVLARERLKFDLTLVLTSEIFACDDKAFPHLIDEAVAFDIEMRDHGYPESEVGCVELLTESGIFERWFELEQQQCTRCMEGLLADESAWNIRYSEVFDLDRFKQKSNFLETASKNGRERESTTSFQNRMVPRCIDNFFSLLTALTHRYKLLRSQQHRQQFVRLQRNLIDDFRMHLFQMTRLSSSPWSTPFPQIINAASYIRRVLSNWQELPFFIDLEAGVFDELIDLFAHFNNQMLRLLQLITREIFIKEAKV
uniref:RAD50-interacting protein 1 n=1 Tax=Romanomermis culicivorax TaxID=13658 RepID=A0A915I0Y0_ROMCU